MAARTSPPKPASPRTRKPAPRDAPSTRDLRLRALSNARRAHVLAGARQAFIELGLEGTSMREIAQRAGYSAGALYSYFASKEEVYGALLGESLERLNAAVAIAGAAAEARPEARLLASAHAFFDFYREHPRDLDLGFYLFQGLQPRGLTPALNDALNARLRAALAPTQAALQAMGMAAADALAEVTALFAHIVGVLMLSHTGRIRMFKQGSQALFDRYLAALLQRARAAR